MNTTIVVLEIRDGFVEPVDKMVIPFAGRTELDLMKEAKDVVDAAGYNIVHNLRGGNNRVSLCNYGQSHYVTITVQKETPELSIGPATDQLFEFVEESIRDNPPVTETLYDVMYDIMKDVELFEVVGEISEVDSDFRKDIRDSVFDWMLDNAAYDPTPGRWFIVREGVKR